jgi:hypothetical protein
VASLPWCQGEPNNWRGEERCSNLGTHCGSGGAAQLNDYGCHRPLRVLCTFQDGQCAAGGSPYCTPQLLRIPAPQTNTTCTGGRHVPLVPWAPAPNAL